MVFFTSIGAQTDFDINCGTTVSPAAIAYEQRMAQSMKAFIEKDGAKQMLTLPLKVFVITNEVGGGGITPAQVEAGIQNLNELFSSASVSFAQCDEPEYVPDSTFYNLRVGEEDELFETYEQAGVINVYIIGGSLASQQGTPLCGFAFFPWNSQRYHLIVQDACYINASSFAHEMGHTLGLYHTHETVFGHELVDGSNCEDAGDLLCDTPADPLLGGGNVNLLCQYTGDETDANGATYSPDQANIMSYSRSSCRDNLSPEQSLRAQFFATAAADQLNCDGSTIGQLYASCEEAFELTDNGTYTADGPAAGNGCQNCEEATHADWFYFDAPSTGQIFIESCGGGVDTRLWVYSGGCTILDLVGQADDECEMGEGLQPFASRIINLPIIAGSRYFFEWDNRWSNAGFDFDFAFYSSTECPNVAPDEFFVLDSGYAHLELAWNSEDFHEQHRLRYRTDANDPWTTEDFQGGAYRLLDNLTPCTSYEIQIQSICFNNLGSDWSDSRFINTLGCDDEYCYSYGSSRRHFIDSVRIGNTFLNPSGNDYGFEFFLEPEMDLFAGQMQVLELIPGSSSTATAAPHLWRVWLDIDEDGSFHPTAELIGEELTTGFATVEIDLPEDLPLITTRMRISLSTESFRDPCQTGGNSDVEDYIVNIIPFTNSVLTFSPDTLFLGQEAGSASFDVFSNTDWNASTEASWLTLGTEMGSGDASVNVDFTANTALEARITTISLATNDLLPQELVVVQNGTQSFLAVSPTEVTLDNLAGSEMLTVISNVDWTATTNADWITLNTSAGNGNGAIDFSYLANTTTESRVDTIFVTSPEVGTVIAVIEQLGEAPFLTVNPLSLNLPAEAGEANFMVNTNTDWMASSAASWIFIDPFSGSTSTMATVSYTENNAILPRVDSILITAPGLPTQTIIITQEGQAPRLTVTPTAINLPAPAGSSSFEIESNTDWDISVAVPWVTLGTASGSGNATITFDYAENAAVGNRIAVIEITAPGLPLQTVTLTQASIQGFLSVAPDTVYLPNTVGSVDLSVTSNLDWTANTNAGWLIFNPGSGTGDATVMLNHASNSSTEVRSTDLQFLADGALPAFVHVIQEATPGFVSTSVDTLFIDAEGGASVFTVFSNIIWNANSSEGWLAIDQTQGNGTVFIDLFVAPNGSTNERIATISVVSPLGPNSELVVVQEGQAPYLTFPVEELVLTPNTADAQVQVFSNVNWSVDNNAIWLNTIGNMGNGDALLDIVHTANNGILPRRDTLRFTAPGLPGEILLPVVQPGQPIDVPWVVSPTSENHTVIIPASFTGQLAEDLQLAAGDAVGFFYVRADGSRHCSNFFVHLPGEASSVAVYGDDSEGSEVKNGFAADERFQLRVYRMADEVEQIVSANFAPTGTNGIVTHEDQYATDGISLIESLSFELGGNFSLQLSQGWNMISSYVQPIPADMLEVLESISADVILIKDQEGATAVPSLGVNSLGDWEVVKGYQIKMLQEAILDIEGQVADPAATPIDLLAGWQMIAYLLPQPSSASGQFASIAEDLDLVKDNLGNVYLPAFGINNLGDLRPGQGYKVRMINATTLTYAQNFIDPTPPTATATPSVFSLPDTYNTGQNATLVIPLGAMEGILSPGDEIGIFNEVDSLAGSAVIIDGNLAITVWGDDALTNGPAEGMNSNMPYRFKLWRAAEDQVYDLAVTFTNGDGLYNEDDLEVIASVSIVTSTAEHLLFAPAAVYPNPLMDYVTIDLLRDEPIDQFLATDATGRQLAVPFERVGPSRFRINTQQWPLGLITLELVSREQRQAVKLVKLP